MLGAASAKHTLRRAKHTLSTSADAFPVFPTFFLLSITLTETFPQLTFNRAAVCGVKADIVLGRSFSVLVKGYASSLSVYLRLSL